MFIRSCLLLCATLGALLAQGQAESMGGTVASVSGNVVYVNTGGRLLALSSDARTEVWKGKVFHDLSAVKVGDALAARYRTDGSGKLIAEAMWLNITQISGVITQVSGSGFQMLTNPNADPQSAYRKENKAIEIDVDTVFEASVREDLKAGRDVRVVGVELQNGGVKATRVALYESGRPLRMKAGAAARRADGTQNR